MVRMTMHSAVKKEVTNGDVGASYLQESLPELFKGEPQEEAEEREIKGEY